MTETFNKLGIEKNFFKVLGKACNSINLVSETLKDFPQYHEQTEVPYLSSSVEHYIRSSNQNNLAGKTKIYR